MVPRQWEGQTAVLIASGPSLAKEDIDYCQGKARVLAVNDNFKLALWADVLYACDPDWWEYYQGVPEFHGQKWCANLTASNRYELNYVSGDHKPGISFDPELLHYGSNSGYQALNLAVLFGAKKIVLLGYDMQRTKGEMHWFGPHPGKLNKSSNYAPWIEAFKSAVLDLEKQDISVINCTRETALDCFPRKELHGVL